MIRTERNTYLAMRAQLAQVQYKPNVTFEVEGPRGPLEPWAPLSLVMRVHTWNANDPKGPMIDVINRRSVFVEHADIMLADPSKLADFLTQWIQAFEMHEVQEFLRIDGVRVYKPH